MRFSLLCPTYNRPVACKEMLDGALWMASQPDGIEAIFGYDDNDPSRDELNRLVVGPPNTYSLECAGELRGRVSKIWARLALISEGDVLLLANDDIRFRTRGWDSIVDAAFDAFPNRVGMVWCQDGINGDCHAAFPFVSREWYEAVGHFTPGIFEFGYNDTWIYDIAKRADRLCYLPDVFIEHMHFTAGKAPMDETYKKQRRDRRWARDGELFESTAGQRQEIAEKLVCQTRPNTLV